VKFNSYTEQYIDSLGAFSDAIIGVLAAVAAPERFLECNSASGIRLKIPSGLEPRAHSCLA
jgi:hypothetical protein